MGVDSKRLSNLNEFENNLFSFIIHYQSRKLKKIYQDKLKKSREVIKKIQKCELCRICKKFIN